MRKINIISTPARLSDLSLDELDDAMDESQDVKAARLEAKKWRSFKSSIRGEKFAIR